MKLSNRKIAAILGIDEITVRRALSATNVAEELEEPAPDQPELEGPATNVAEDEEWEWVDDDDEEKSEDLYESLHDEVATEIEEAERPP